MQSGHHHEHGNQIRGLLVGGPLRGVPLRGVPQPSRNHF